MPDKNKGHRRHSPARTTSFVRRGEAWARALEAEDDRWFLFVPVLFGAGILLYFSLSFEPNGRLALGSVLAALGLFFVASRASLGVALGLAFVALSLGFANAKLRTEMVRAPVLTSELRHVAVSGYVETFEVRAANRDRLTLRVIGIGSLSAVERPRKVRITVAAENTNVKTGEAVIVRASLRPPPDPVEPGGFDFGRQAWFKQIGGMGYATGSITRLEHAAPPPWNLRFWAVIDALRDGVRRRVRAALPGETGGIAVALITGDRGGIPQDVTEAMRDSGLAHILAISGLHMAIMAGSVFWLARALLAAIPGLALRFAVKKWAAIIALLAATLYLALSGMTVPTVRAYIMMSVFLVAVLMDRPAISMRNVALAALAILVVAPESLFEPGFQMSFAAVVGLVAFYEWFSGRKPARTHDTHRAWRGLRWSGALIGGAALTTLIAGTAVAPFAVYHFHHMAHFGVVANMIAAPLVSLLIMPMALLALVAMPFGLEALPLHAMGAGIELLVGVADRVASWPGAVSILPSLSATALALIALGGIWLCLWRTRMRALGLAIAAVGLAIVPVSDRPDIIVEREGRTAALRGSHGALIFPSAQAANYSVENWLLADGDDRNAADLPSASPFRCDPLGCIGRVKGKTVALIRDVGALQEDCRSADIVITPFPLEEGCNAARVIVDRRALENGGAHALYIEDLSIRTETVAQIRGARPWARTGRPRHKARIEKRTSSGE